MIVVDTNILAYLYMPGPYAHAAQRLQLTEPTWAAPTLWRSEFRNILSGYLRRGDLTLDQAHALAEEAQALMAGAEYEADSYAVFKLVRNSRCTAYDCEFVALAQQLGVRLYTMDRQILQAFPDTACALPVD